MNVGDTSSPTAIAKPAPSPEKTLRRLFLLLFLRGRTSRGLKKQTAPKSIGQRLSLTLVFYAAFGCISLALFGQTVFAVSVYLHAMTFVFLGMFVAASAGEILFNKEEADILMHRPIGPRTLLWAKVRVLVEISLWLGGAFNLAGFFVGLRASDGKAWFPAVHAGSTVLEALFCTGCVVVTYQLCLRWFGREKLEGLMTTAQVIVAITVVIAGQLLPQLVFRPNHILRFDAKSWWIALLPPAWFAGFDDALAGSMSRGSWLLAGLAAGVTGAVMWAAFGKLAQDYEAGMQALGETVSHKARSHGGRWIDRMISLPPLRWWLRDPVERAAFLLSAAYLARDRDVKLRIYPGVAPFLAIPVLVMIRHGGASDPTTNGFGIAFVAAYAGLIPMMAVNILQYSQNWQAADIFRAAPLPGPGPLCHGARRAIICFVGVPMVIAFVVLVWVMQRDWSQLAVLLPGIIALPVYAIVPSVQGNGVPLSMPPEEAKNASRGVLMVAAMFVSMAIAGVGLLAQHFGLLWWMIAAETVVVLIIYASMRGTVNKRRWESME